MGEMSLSSHASRSNRWSALEFAAAPRSLPRRPTRYPGRTTEAFAVAPPPLALTAWTWTRYVVPAASDLGVVCLVSLVLFHADHVKPRSVDQRTR